MQNEGLNENAKEIEKLFIGKIIELEGLFISKANIYSRLLTDAALAKNMSEIATRREKLKKEWKALLTGEQEKQEENSAQSEQSEQNEQGEEE